jgi:hypothetical protein
MEDFPIPVEGGYAVSAPAPGSGPGHWAGAPSAAIARDGSLLVAYRVRTPDRRGSSLVLAHSDDRGRLTAVAALEKERFGAESLERPALVRLEGGWRLYVSCATPNSKHWRIDVVEASDPAGLARAEPRTVFPGTDLVGVKDPVVRRARDAWEAWICCHPLDEPGEEDRMTTAYATSRDGLDWDWHGTALSGRAASWDARGARVTAVLDDGRAAYDGRAGREENFSERTGIALPKGRHGRLVQAGDAPVSNARYLDVVARPGGGWFLFFEMPRPDGSHDLCFESK